MNHLITWYLSLSVSAAAALAFAIFLVFCIGICALVSYFDPLKVEMRAIRRKRRVERKLIAQTRAMLLQRHDSAADRHCYRELQR